MTLLIPISKDEEIKLVVAQEKSGKAQNGKSGK
jgi:hypothetical protein